MQSVSFRMAMQELRSLAEQLQPRLKGSAGPAPARPASLTHIMAARKSVEGYLLTVHTLSPPTIQSSHVAIAMYLTLCAMLLRCPAMCLLGGRCELRWLAGGMCDPVLINKPFKLQVPRALTLGLNLG